MYTFYTVLPFSSQLFLHRGAIIFISQLPAASGTSSSPLASIHFQRKIFEIRRSSQLFRTSGLFAHFNLLCFFFSLYRSFFVLNHASLMRLRVLPSGSRGFISRSFSKFVRSCVLAIISVLSRILCLASSSLFFSPHLSFCVLSRSVRFFRKLL